MRNAIGTKSISRTSSIFALFEIHMHHRARARAREGMIKKKLRSPHGPFNGLDPAIALCKLEFIDYCKGERTCLRLLNPPA